VRSALDAGKKYALTRMHPATEDRYQTLYFFNTDMTSDMATA